MRPILLPSRFLIAVGAAALLTGWSAFAAELTGLIAASSPVAVASPSPSPPEPVIRTPARLYGSAYSVKVKLVRGEFDWVVPVWIKPDAATSSFDMSLMRLMGWSEPKFVFDEVSLSGTPIEKTKFNQANADWAYLPNFSKSCCAGILGRDVLDQFEIRFDPRVPAHLEWRKLAANEKSKSRKAKVPSADLQGIFSLRGTTYKKHNLTQTPYRLNLQEGELEFESPKGKSK